MTSDGMQTVITKLSTITLAAGLLTISLVPGARAQTFQAILSDEGQGIQARICNGEQCTSFGMLLPRITTKTTTTSGEREGASIHLNLN